MSYKDRYHPKIKSDLKCLDRTVVKEIFSFHIEEVLAKPHKNERLHGEMKEVLSYHFKKNNVDYRIAYAID